MPEPSAPPPSSGGSGGGSFLTKKWGPLPVAAYVVAAAALIGILVFRNRSTGASRTTPGPIAAPTGIQDPSLDQSAAFVDTLTGLENSIHGLQGQVTSLQGQLATAQAGSTGTAPTSKRLAPPVTPGGGLTHGGRGGGEAPDRILPDYVLRPPVHLDTEMTARGINA